ncbi:MAG TPA: GNAT family acetyltransferase [Candidatus Lumbricidophila sp.]|nr:GNAT family acetyltransferase [Candidatus Lumbricidophila sp.]
MQIRQFTVADTEHVGALWAAAGLTKPWNDPRKDIARKLAVQPELFVVAVDESGTIIGTAMAGYDGHRGWLYYLATAPDARGAGVGRTLVEHVEQALLKLGCPKLNLQVRTSNPHPLGFYDRLGYSLDETTSLGKRLITD